MPAPTPSILILGIHSITSEDAELRQQLERYYEQNTTVLHTPAVQDYLSRIVPLVLIEVVVWNLTEAFDVGNFRQAAESQPEEAWQVAYDETVLTTDGTAVTAQGEGSFIDSKEGRLTFFLHYFDPKRSLQWSYGEVPCPPLSPLPVRLSFARKYQLPG
jgi:hypothetical protein